MRGGEKCLEALGELYPASPICTLFYERGKISEPLAAHPIRTSWVQKLPGIYKNYRRYLPLFPAAVQSFCLNDYDLVLSTSHCVAKGIRKPKGSWHLCYCFTPMRYAWGFFEEYFGKKNAGERHVIKYFIDRLRDWDLKANAGVDCFVAISDHVRKRIREFYGRDAAVIYPPVETDYFTPDGRTPREEFYLAVSALVPYKRMELAIETFNQIGRPLVIIGDGPERKSLERMAGPAVRFLGWQPADVLRDYYRRARALIFPGEEDFGIVPVEMQSCGGCVIAYGRGGALETILENRTGLFFYDATTSALADAVSRFEKSAWDPAQANTHALGFNRDRFKKEISEAIRQMFFASEKEMTP